MSTSTEQDRAAHGSSSEFVALEEKIYRTIELLKHAREAKAAAERDVSRLREELETREEEIERMKIEMISLRKEKEDVKSRVEKMVEQMDSLLEG